MLRITGRSLNATSTELHLAVSDTGVGIAEDKRQTIFSEFEQADTSTTRQFGGTGLGLAISSSLVELMGGRIWVESELGQGSTFHLSIPFEQAAPDTPRPIERDPQVLDGMQVLIVDDNSTNLQIMKEVTQGWGMQPITVDNGPTAIETLRACQDAGKPVGLILTDINMPGMDGFMLAERIRADENFASTVIIALTSGGRFEDSVKRKQLDITAELMKPVKQSELLDAIINAVAPPATAHSPKEATASPADTTSGIQPLKILLAEDGRANQILAVGLLKRWGHQVTVAENGKIAIDVWQNGDFDLILMDLQMPEMDGIDATKWIRQKEQEQGGHIPIIAMTAHALVGYREKCLAAGMDGYVSKPVRKQQLYDAIEPFFGSGDAPIAPTPSDGPKPAS